ncbi:MAG: phytanoyl-CoA dioxygenase family protein [Sphingobacteriales bacterium]|nr:MAG: phytanoyl-CoA dioxygenase family protein [Sphingobacteriales bacterium]
MFRNIIDLIRKKEELKTIQRDFSPRYFINDEHQRTYNDLGYVVIRNCIPNSIIQYANKTYYDLISKQSGFVLNDKFQNSGRFDDTNIRNLVIDEINKISLKILDDIVIKENCEQKTGGAFQIKPASSTSILNPHQDSPIIDETKYYATYIWIPLCDTNVKNGTLCLTEKSSLGKLSAFFECAMAI